jgi:hypothetical protein
VTDRAIQQHDWVIKLRQGPLQHGHMEAGLPQLHPVPRCNVLWSCYNPAVSALSPGSIPTEHMCPAPAHLQELHSQLHLLALSQRLKHGADGGGPRLVPAGT